MMCKPRKPIGGKAYGFIPHLPLSRMGPSDHHCHEGQQVILTEKPRDKHDRIIVCEKLDGACVSVANVNGSILPLIRAGYEAHTAFYPHLRAFGHWVDSNVDLFARLLPGYRICGEWIAMAHGTIYKTATPFVAFDMMDGRGRRPLDDLHEFCTVNEIPYASVIHDGGPCSTYDALERLGSFGFHGAVETVEGAVWRCERKGQFDFIAKFVRHDKIDGKYVPGLCGNADDAPPVWNCPTSHSPSKETV